MPTLTDRIDITGYLRQHPADMAGWSVIAIDEPAGKLVDKHTEIDERHMVVHVGPPVLGSDVVVETDVVTSIDTDTHEIHVDRIADWVKSSPKFKNYKREH